MVELYCGSQDCIEDDDCGYIGTWSRNDRDFPIYEDFETFQAARHADDVHDGKTHGIIRLRTTI